MLFCQMLQEKNLKYFGDRFMCEIILSHKYSFTDDLRTTIIYTLTRIENVLIYVAHACIVAGQYIIDFLSTFHNSQ